MLLIGFFDHSLLCVQYIVRSIKEDVAEQEGRPPVSLMLPIHTGSERTPSKEKQISTSLKTNDHAEPGEYFRMKVGRDARNSEIIALKTKGKRTIFLQLPADLNCSDVIERFS